MKSSIYIILILSILQMGCQNAESGKEGSKATKMSSKQCVERKYHNISFCTSTNFELKEIKGCIDSDCITFVHNGDELNIDISPYAGKYLTENKRVFVLEQNAKYTGASISELEESMQKTKGWIIVHSGEPSDPDYYGHNAEFRKEGDYYVKFKYPRTIGHGSAVIYGAIYWEDKLDYVSCFSIACKNPSKETIQFMREIFESIEIKDPILL